MSQENFTLESVKEYYGKVLSGSKDLKTSACCISGNVPSYQKEVLSKIHSEVLEKFYGCGSPIPLALKGKTVLDLGSGSGRDVYLIAGLAGKGSRVIGIDMTDEQLSVAKAHLSYHEKAFGLESGSISFRKGFIEDLITADIADNSVDVVVSNCVINLSPNKKKVFQEIMRVLKPGGELLFSDVFCSRRLPKEFSQDPVLLGECLGGALYTEDMRRIFSELGVKDFRVLSNSKLIISDEAIARKLEGYTFSSTTLRAFKLDLEDRCEDFGQVANYKGGIPNSERFFVLDDHHVFEQGKPMLVCGNTADMLSQTRFGEYFQVTGDKSKHFGLFDCAPAPTLVDTKVDAKTPQGACC
ncbi:MAG: methyltransferase domain-containing protein [Bdellovibrionota bacterium]